MITKEELLEELLYDKELGKFFWKNKQRNAKQWSEAGSFNDRWYKRIGIKNKYYYVHRLVWLCETGSFPIGIIDHKNRDKTDNRFSNLRVVSFAENAQNIVNPHGKSKSGLRGVDYDERYKKYRVRIIVDGRTILIGFFDDSESARLAYLSAKKKFHPSFYSEQPSL